MLILICRGQVLYGVAGDVITAAGATAGVVVVDPAVGAPISRVAVLLINIHKNR